MKLSQAEFAHNRSTYFGPFSSRLWFLPRGLMDLLCLLMQGPPNRRVDDLMVDLQQLHADTRARLQEADTTYKFTADQHPGTSLLRWVTSFGPS